MAFSGLLFGYAIISMVSSLIWKLISNRTLRLIKKDDPELYDEITQGYKERWTEPGGGFDTVKDKAMVNRFHEYILTGKCSNYMSERLYWTYRIVCWIATPFPYLLGIVIFIALCVMIFLFVSS